MKCRVCGKEFKTERNTKTCSEACREIYSKRTIQAVSFNRMLPRGSKFKTCERCGRIFYAADNRFNECRECRGLPEASLTVKDCKLCQKCVYRDTHDMCGYAAENETMRGEPVGEHCSKFLPKGTKGAKKPKSIAVGKKRGRPKKNKVPEVRLEKEELMNKIVLEPKEEQTKPVVPDTVKESPRDLEEPSRDDIVKAIELLRTVCKHHTGPHTCRKCPIWSNGCRLVKTEPRDWPSTTTEDAPWRAFN